jgi:hypothetical protein
MADVKVFKTVLGEEMIATIDKFDGGVYVLSDVLGIGIDQREGKLVFVPYMPYTSAAQSINLFATSLVFEPVDPVDSIYNDYMEATRKIVTPRSGRLLTPVK